MKTILKTIAALVGLTGVMAGTAEAETIHSVTQISYDIRNQPVCTAVRMNTSAYGSLPADACALGTQSGLNGPDRITRNSYDAAGQLIQVDQAYGTSVQRAHARYTYTINGLKATEKDANGNQTTLEYDGFDRLKKLRYSSTTVGSGTSSTTDYEDYDYDANNNRTYWRRRDGQVINDCFDNLNRVIIHYVHAQSGCTATGGTKDVYTNYNGSGQIVSKRFASFSGSGVTYAYDSLGRLSSTTDMNSRTISYQYNVAGARTRLQFPDGINIDYALDNTSRVTSLGWNASSGAYSRDYNSLGQLTAETKGGGSVSYAYDGIGRLASFTNNLSGTTSDIAWTFGYNPAGQIVSNDPSSTLYDYEELTPVTEPAQSHDGLNRVANLVGATGACPSGGYDARGNLICDGTGRSYNYDVENRLLTGNIAGNGLTLTYDPEGRLASYSWNGGAVSFLYDGVNLVGEYNSSNQMLRRYVHGPGTDNPIIWYEGSGNGTRRYFYTNYQGSVITTADASGNRGDIYTYGAYGEPKDQSGFTYWPSIGTGSTSVSRFGYTGQMFLADARLYYYKARIYDPQMGRFLQTDPIGGEDDLNMYAYVAGDPVNKGDPTGMFADLPNDDTIKKKMESWPVPGHERLNERDTSRQQGAGEFGTPRSRGTHSGIDINAPVGTKVVSPGDGTVTSVAPNPSATYGNQVAVDHGDGVFTVGAHMDTVSVKVGDRVDAGQAIGTVGTTGNTPKTADPHLHFEIRLGDTRSRLQGGTVVDPQKYLPKSTLQDRSTYCFSCGRNR